MREEEQTCKLKLTAQHIPLEKNSVFVLCEKYAIITDLQIESFGFSRCTSFTFK